MAKKKLFTLEYPVKSSPHILYDFVSIPSEMALWFADNVSSHLNTFTFTWNGNNEEAEMIEAVQNEYIRYRWSYQAKDEYFEFRVKTSDISMQTVLMITDFAEPNEIEDQQLLWDSQVKSLKEHIGGMG